ncbi:hypothetical protein BpHYR1_022775 [Brachionus plicatilis]|uniref:Uncharacterized protein n=1 Tax=Brachionus plicatilis TaxID=10195 RepID=A0A3M7QKT2_BRAPC|nr:hypothetical protein BpHYR1_022775 [Brachionus plicatilis]
MLPQIKDRYSSLFKTANIDCSTKKKFQDNQTNSESASNRNNKFFKKYKKILFCCIFADLKKNFVNAERWKKKLLGLQSFFWNGFTPRIGLSRTANRLLFSPHKLDVNRKIVIKIGFKQHIIFTTSTGLKIMERI